MISLALGEASSVSTLTDLAHALAIALVAGAVAAYHWRVLRSDTHRSQPVPLEAGAPAQVVVQLRAADAETLEQALSILRARGIDVSVYA